MQEALEEDGRGPVNEETNSIWQTGAYYALELQQNAYVEIPGVNFVRTFNYTITAWINPIANTSMCIIDKGYPEGFSLNLLSNQNKLILQVCTVGYCVVVSCCFTNLILKGGKPIPTNDWTFIAVVFKESKIYLFHNFIIDVIAAAKEHAVIYEPPLCFGR